VITRRRASIILISALFAGSCFAQTDSAQSEEVFNKTLAGYKVHIPKHIILATMKYYDSPINNELSDFDFILQLPNLDEVTTREQRERLANPLPPTETRGDRDDWLIGDFSNSLASKYGGDYPRDRFHFWHNDIAKDGPYKQVTDEFGLGHWIVDYQNRNIPPASDPIIDDLYYDNISNTVITCRKYKTVRPPLYSWAVCNQIFNIEKYDSFVEISFSKKLLKNWRFMRDKITSKFEQFSE
jgi:hypothetical protein